MEKYWNVDEFVSYEEYAEFGISGEVRDRNLERADKKSIPFGQLCPLCFKELKEGSYKTLIVNTEGSCSRYYYNPNAKGTPIKIGRGCFKHIMEAYRAKYNK
jgi:hypothetical protein